MTLECASAVVCITNDGAHLPNGGERMRYEREREKTDRNKSDQWRWWCVCVCSTKLTPQVPYSLSYHISESKCKSIKWFVSASNRNVDRIEVCGRKHFNYLLSRILDVYANASVCVCITHKFSSRSVPAAWTIIVEKHKNEKSNGWWRRERMNDKYSAFAQNEEIPDSDIQLPSHCQNVASVLHTYTLNPFMISKNASYNLK